MADTELWTASLGGNEVRASTRDIHARQDSSDLYGVELRITRNGELHARSMELFEKLSAKGWVKAEGSGNSWQTRTNLSDSED